MAATMMALESLLHALPRLASVAAFLCLMFAHLLWPAIGLPQAQFDEGNERDDFDWRQIWRRQMTHRQ
jgi:hypothetical protein